ncbi:MAG: hypothetical protein JXB00_18530 [Bacteroidales bacterium]|nr:hypothetical protein [Bacteroidales bacterium]
MKKSIITSILALLIAGAGEMRAQEWPDEYLGLPGDNLNLYAVMELFRESETLEGFERSLNDEKNMINNLDLNGDNMVDYIAVTDYKEGNVHTIVLRAMLSRNESQDVAVFTVEQFRNGEVQIQLIGDEALYGKNYIVEPNYAETPNPGYKDKAVVSRNITVVTTTYHDIALWPVVRFIYHPSYLVWRSSWYWGYYPVYWRPWRAYYWHYYYGYHYNWHNHYYAHYRHCHHYRYPHYNTYYYTSIRTYSPRVNVNISRGYYKSTYSRPEMRREGEARYASVNANRTTRPQMGTASATRTRTNEARTAQASGRASANTITNRRSATSAANHNVTRSAAAPRNTAGGRTINTSARRPVEATSATRGTYNTRKPATAVTQQRSRTTEATRGASTAGRSAVTTSPSATRRTSTVRPVSSAPSKTTGTIVSTSRSVTGTTPAASRGSASGNRQVHATSPSGRTQATQSRSVSRPVGNVSKSTSSPRSSSHTVSQRSSSRPGATNQRSASSSHSRSSSAATAASRRGSSR